MSNIPLLLVGKELVGTYQAVQVILELLDFPAVQAGRADLLGQDLLQNNNRCIDHHRQMKQRLHLLVPHRHIQLHVLYDCC